MKAKVRIGTASWKDPGFIADWYPRELPASQHLRWYAEHFDYVELNSSFYGVPQIKAVESWCQQTPDDFLFDVKVHKLLSRHSVKPEYLPAALRRVAPIKNGKVGLTPKFEKLVARHFLAHFAPMAHCRKLGAFLLQLSPAFRPKTNQLEELETLIDEFQPHVLAIELRNRYWVDPEHKEKTYDFFKTRKVSLVNVDSPASDHFTVMPTEEKVTNPSLVYFRLHGRNEPGYVRGRKVEDRFNYQYSKREISDIASKIEDMTNFAEEIHVAFNNNKSNFAPVSAELLKKRLSRKTAQENALSEH
jgi:uncharacterized protein YecE (DUF72 family)